MSVQNKQKDIAFNQIVWMAVLLASVSMLQACLPKEMALSKEEKDRLEKAHYPYENDLIYDNALTIMGEYINDLGDYKVRVQPKIINSITGSDNNITYVAEIPFNITDMAITALARISGSKFAVLPYDPEFINNDLITGGLAQRALPTVLVSGSITEFDRDIMTTSRDLNLDILVGGGDGETDIGFDFSGDRRMSRVALDLHLLSYRSHSVIPGVAVSNTVNVIELEKGKDFGFAIHGSGFGINGRVRHSQGFHRAVRNLVEYSILQLFGKYYNLPYWKLLGMKGSDSDVLRSISKGFEKKSAERQILEIKRLLNRMRPQLKEVKDPENDKVVGELNEDGKLNKQTLLMMASFLSQYAPEIPEDDLTAIYIKLREVVTISKMIENFPAVIEESQQQTSKEDETTSAHKFFEKFKRIENVYQYGIQNDNLK